MNTHCQYPGCKKPIETPTPNGKYCLYHRELVRQEHFQKLGASRRKLPDEETAHFNVTPAEETKENIDCGWWRVRKCDLLLEKVCKNGDCGFYPPTAARRKAAIREGLRTPHDSTI